MTKTYIETFDDGPGGWLSQAGPGQPVRPEIRDGAAISRGPWWVDANHAPPGAGYLHLLFFIHTFYPAGFSKEIIAACAPNRFTEGGFSRDLRDAKIHVRIRGDVKLCGSQLVLLAQSNIAKDPNKPNWVNQVLSSQPLRVTKEWSEQTLHLTTDQEQWTKLGGRQQSMGFYGNGPIEEVLRDLKGDLIFVLFPLDVRPLKPIKGDPHFLYAGRDYEIDRSRLPEGHVMLDEVRIEFPS